MINVGIIGAGHWGKNLVRNFNATSRVENLLVCDSNEDLLNKISQQFRRAQLYTDMDTLLEQPDLDAVVIATPPKMHAEHARKALEKNLHILVEKPLATSLEDAHGLVEYAEEKNRILMVDHTFLYNNIVEKVKDIVQSGELGEIYYIYSRRINLGIIRQDVDAIWNFAPHDISIANYILEALPVNVTANAHCYIQKKLSIPDVAYMNLVYDNGVSVNIHNSWLDPFKRRDMVIVGSEKMLVYDDINSDRHIQIFDKKVNKELFELENFADYRAVIRSGDVHILNIKLKEPLAAVTDHFIDCIEKDIHPKTYGKHATEIVAILEAVQVSIDNDSVRTVIRYPYN